MRDSPLFYFHKALAAERELKLVNDLGNTLNNIVMQHLLLGNKVARKKITGLRSPEQFATEGLTVARGDESNKHQALISDLSSGIYFAEGYHPGNVIQQKIMVLK